MNKQNSFPRMPYVSGLGTLLQRLRGMSFVLRWNFHSHIKQQSVADHSFWVTMYTYILIQIRAIEKTGPEVDLGRALAHAVMHDMEESITCDLPFLIKREIKKPWAELRDKAINQMIGKLPDQYRLTMNEDLNGVGQTIKDLVKAADLLDVVRYCAEEEALGNIQFKRIYQETVTRLWAMAEEYHEIGTFLYSWGVVEMDPINLPQDMTHL